MPPSLPGPSRPSTSGLRAHLLREHRSTLSLEDGVLEGAGAEILLQEGAAAQFFLLGEEHGVADIPALAAALHQAADPERWTLFDPRPLRPHLDADRIAPDAYLREFIWGYGAVVVLVGSGPATFDP